MPRRSCSPPRRRAAALGIEPLGALVPSAVGGVDPRVMGIGSVPAVRKLLARAGGGIDGLDLVELNEAFASQSLAVVRELGLDEKKVNVKRRRDRDRPPARNERCPPRRHAPPRARRRAGRYGVTTMCVGVGQGQAALFERQRPPQGAAGRAG